MAFLYFLPCFTASVLPKQIAGKAVQAQPATAAAQGLDKGVGSCCINNNCCSGQRHNDCSCCS